MEFSTETDLAENLYQVIVSDLAIGIERRGRAGLIMAGGRSPKALLSRLANAQLDWGSISLTVTDERWVSVHSSSSNEGQIFTLLGKHLGNELSFISLKSSHALPSEGVQEVNARLDRFPWPATVAVVGMGEDGHVASLFPTSCDSGSGYVVATRSESFPEERLSLRMNALGRTEKLILLVSNMQKWETLQKSMSKDCDLPVAQLLKKPGLPVTIFHCTSNKTD